MGLRSTEPSARGRAVKQVLALIGARLVWMAAILLVLSFALFGVLAALPGDPVDLLVTSNPNIRPDDVARLKKLRGLDRPWPVRWARWLVGHRQALSPPPLRREPPLVVDMPLQGPARVHLDVAGEGSSASGREVVLDTPGVHELPRVVRDAHGLEGLVIDEVLVSPPLDDSGGTAPTPDDPPDGRGPARLGDDDRQLGGSTEHKLGVGRASEQERAAAARNIGRAVALAAPRVYAADADGNASVDARDLLSPAGSRNAGSVAADLDRWTFDVVTGPGTFRDGRWSHRFGGPGQSAVVFRATAPTGAHGLGAFAVDHGLIEDPTRFSRGALFVLIGDSEALGYSSTYKRPVWELLFGGVAPDAVEQRPWSQRVAAAIQRFGRVQNTLCLMLPALLLSLLFAVPLGALAAARRGGLIDAVVQAVSVAGVAMPAFWLGIMAMQVFAVALPWLPAGGIQTPGLTGLADVVIDRLRHAVLPVGVLAFAWTGQWLRWVRSGLLEVLPSDFVRTARAKGVAPRAVLVEHALKNALIPLITVLALAAPQLFAGALLTETVFAWPGVGRLQYEAIINNDSYVAIVVFLVSAMLVLLANLAADLLYVVVDPRLRRGRP